MVKELARRNWTIDPRTSVSFTISAGVTAWKAGDTAAALIERADQGLYKAKRSGRNRSVKIT